MGVWYNAFVVEPRIIPREEHPISRRDIDPDALKVLYRLRQFNYTAYLVGGSVRDLLLGRRPKDFDIGTSAHPYQIKKLFRNCWIIGRRFRLAHVRFGQNVIEVATFRRQVEPGEEIVQDGVPAPDPSTPEGEHLIHRDNTFGTPEEDAFRRDFTINALFYDIANFSVIDYVGGLDDLRAGVVRSIGDPHVRLREDPVRMIRAIALAARLDFTIDPDLLDAIRTHRHEISKSSAPRLLEEYYKILRAGASEKAFRGLAEVGLLEPISAELHRGADQSLWRSLAELDAYRRKFPIFPETLTNPILLGSLLVPLGVSLHRRRADDWGNTHAEADDRGNLIAPPQIERRRTPAPRLGALPIARRDMERLQQLLGLQRRLAEAATGGRGHRGLVHRSIFREALTWLEVHGGDAAMVEFWTAQAAGAPAPHTPGEVVDGDQPTFRRRRRRRRRRRGLGARS
jgi:poly(A) polymerase